MRNYNPVNERIKYQYLAYLKEAKQQSQSTIDDVAAALARFEGDTGYRDFKAFHYEQAIAFKRRLTEHQSNTTGNKLSKATMYSMLAHLKRLFQWRAGQPSVRSRIRLLTPSTSTSRIRTPELRRRGGRSDSATMEQVKHAIATMPCRTEIERRNRAVVAFRLLTGARDSATASMKLKHLDLTAGSVFRMHVMSMRNSARHSPRTFFPVGEEIRRIIEDWANYLLEVKL